MATIDLHLHSNYSSDGEFSPTELVALCLQSGLTYAAIADHNSVRAVAEALQAADGTSLSIIPAIEMDVCFGDLVLHLLGYGINHHAAIFSEIEQDVRRQEQESSVVLMHLVHQLGFDFDDDFVGRLAVDGVVTGEMMAEAALHFDSQGKNPLLNPYRNGGNRSDNPYANFYWDYCAKGKPAHVPIDYVTLGEGIEIIRANHGVPVLAHPGQQVKENAQRMERLIKEGLDGLEVYSSYHNREQISFYKQAAREHDLLLTCGSDFHGKTKPGILIGGTDCEEQEIIIIEKLLEKISQ
jgi:hypothetical protein